MNKKEIIEILEDEIEFALDGYRESKEADMNCYGTGYDCGFYKGLTMALQIIKDEEIED